MATAALILAVLALFLALAARGKAAGYAQQIEDAGSDVRRRIDNVSEEVEAQLRNMRHMLADVAAGAKLDRDQVLEGRLWGEVNAGEGKRLLEAGDLQIVDVREPQETAGGVIPGAILIPLNDLESRKREIANDGRTTMLVCAGGARSAAACEYLSNEGWTNLKNLEGGMMSWSGPVERPNA